MSKKAPLFFLCAGLIKLTSKGPVFYRWKIIGQNGKRITSYKFRSMREDAEQGRQGAKGTRGQGDKGTRGQGDKETGRQGDKERGR